MIGLDTNVLLRFLLRDDEDCFQRVKTLFDTAPDQSLCVCSVVLAETIWTLRRKRKTPKEGLMAFGRKLLAMRALYLPEADAFSRALDRYESGGADLADYFIAELNARAGASQTLTFDVKAQRDALFRAPPLA